MSIHSYLNRATRLHRHWNQLKQPLRQLSYLTSRHEIKDRYDAVVIGAGGLNVLLPPANEVWGKVIFLHLSHSVHRGGVPGQVPLRAGTPPRAGTAPGNACWDTVNKRAVPILLECIQLKRFSMA